MAQGSVELMQRAQRYGQWAGCCRSILGDAERPDVTRGCSDGRCTMRQGQLVVRLYSARWMSHRCLKKKIHIPADE
jgi:hypothetical protein